MTHAILGTAGHIDHGKTALIKALTGCDTDRLKEERLRGISIDLGFAAFDGDGVTAGVVDVPGHERFIRNMLAGAHGIDLVLLVVAADDGVMPQTEEHLDILHLLGVRRGIVAMTKVDIVEPARRTAVREEIEILLDGTTLEQSPVHEVSSVSGEGIEDLRVAIQHALREFVRPEPEGCFRLPVDRAFLIHGHGLVVTGTATAGSVRAGETVRVLPGGGEARVRSVQVHGRAVETASFGQRVALNLSGIELGQLGRGHVVCAPELDRVTDRFDARIELRPAAARPLRTHSLVRVHLGTAEAMGKIVWLDGRSAVAPKESAYAQIVLREPLAAFGGDHFILREQTARATIGGGVVLHPFPARSTRRPDTRLPLLESLHTAASPLDRLNALLAIETSFTVAAHFVAAAANVHPAKVRSELAGRRDIRPLPNAAQAEAYTTDAKWEKLAALVVRTLTAYHEENPRQHGMEMESLRTRVLPDSPPNVFRVVVTQLEETRVLLRQESLVRLPHHHVGLDRKEQDLARRVESLLGQAGVTPPDQKEIESQLGVASGGLQDLLRELERDGRVVRVAPQMYFSPGAVEEARELIRRHVASGGEVTAASFRDLIGASRKFSIALLNHFDRTGFTMRIGDVRKLQERRS